MNPIRFSLPTAASVPLLLLLLTGGLLGLTTNLVKVATSAGLSPLVLLTWSVLGSSALLVAFASARGMLPRPGPRLAEYSLASAILGVVAPNLILYSAIPHVGAGFVALALAFPPLFTYAGAVTLGMEPLRRSRAAGVLLALSGAALIAGLEFRSPHSSPGWTVATLVAPVVLAAGNLYRSARWPRGERPQSLAPATLATAAAFLLLAAGVRHADLLSVLDRPVFGLLVGAQIAVSSLQYVLFFALQQRGGPVYLSLLGSVAAVVSIPVAVLVLGEAPLRALGPGALLIASGIFLVSRSMDPARGNAAGPSRSASVPVGLSAGRSWS